MLQLIFICVFQFNHKILLKAPTTLWRTPGRLPTLLRRLGQNTGPSNEEVGQERQSSQERWSFRGVHLGSFEGLLEMRKIPLSICFTSIPVHMMLEINCRLMKVPLTIFVSDPEKLKNSISKVLFNIICKYSTTSVS